MTDVILTYKNEHDRIIDLAGQKINRIYLSKSSGLHFINGAIDPAAVKEQVIATECSDVSFDKFNMLANNGLAYGFKFTDCSKVVVSNSRIDRPFQGINAGRVHDLKVLNTFIVGMNNDGIVLVNDEDVVIDNNVITATVRLDGRHPDGIQLDAKDGLNNKNIVISNNWIVGAIQPIFGGTVDNCMIRGNRVQSDHGNGIRIQGTNISLIDNEVLTWPGAPHMCNIILDPASVIERHGNYRGPFGSKPAVKD